MTKILIVDDEQIERDGLQLIIERNFPSIVVKQAKNGRIATEIVDEFQPDLVFMDIQMPGMTGLEAIEAIKYKNSQIKFIMATAFASFEYARLAMKLGVEDYIVKPAKASEIVDILGKVLSKIEAEKELVKRSKHQQYALQKAKSIFETDIVTQLIFDHVHEVQLEELVELLDIQATKEKYVMNLILPLGSEAYYSAIREKVRQTKSGWVGALYGRQLPIIVFLKPDQSFRSQATLLAREILKIAKTYEDCEWFIGIGNLYSSLEQIKQSYQESLIATRDTTIPAKFRFYDDVPPLVPGFDENLSKKNEQQFFNFVRNGQWDEIGNSFVDIIETLEKESTPLFQAQQRVMELFWIASQVLSEMGAIQDIPVYSLQATDYRQLRAETSHLLDRVRTSYEEYHAELGTDSIQLIKKYIIEHAHKDISLDTIGKEVGLSPIYISKIFKEQLGINYIHFLTECRIEKAKKLMRDPEKSLKEITYEVGYHDPNYFSKVFRRMCNVTPTEYRKQLIG
ncbi:two-component system response regulator YesN [Bacillus mesophilus]|uniref:Response regulator n=1 Tax=Bacillus mesophilus TaxID=1808955 RepID=A0A6M0Q836_9BACI|nr:response regulator [Bacillus mesophilus]MBM7661775.1 two-component system response regulator YesN [Bacillus mesophilus]NEY72433.1 response regulator [Bacillus mesophilus]